MLKNDATGQVVQCGGNTSASFWGGAIGYHMQKSSDSECIASYAEQGFRRINPGGEATAAPASVPAATTSGQGNRLETPTSY